jgi:hypothetical protein
VTRRIVCTPEKFGEIKNDPLLAPALRLARAVNALRALKTGFVASNLISEDAKLRQKRNIMLHLGATLYEALLILDDLGPEFGSLPIVREQLIPLRRAEDWRKLRTKVLKPIRNSVAFHFNPEVLPTALDDLTYDPFVFAVQDTEDSLGLYYQLADEALIPAAFKDGDYGDHDTNYLAFLNDVIVYAGYFCRAVDAVLKELTVQLGFSEVVD